METPAKILNLEYPVKWGDETVSELAFYRFKAKALKGVKFGDDVMSEMALLVSVATRQPPSFVEELDGKDFMAAKDVILDFLGLSPETGKKSSDGLPTG